MPKTRCETCGRQIIQKATACAWCAPDVKPIPDDVLRSMLGATAERSMPCARMHGPNDEYILLYPEDLAREILALREALAEVAETEPVRLASEMDDPGRVPCFVNTEWARKARALLGESDA